MAKKAGIAKQQLSMSELIKLTNKEHPSPQHMALIKARLDDDDALVRVNEFAERALAAVMDQLTDSALMKELYNRQIRNKREEFGFENASVMERMLINQVILCHMRMCVIEGFHAQKMKQSHTTEQGIYWDRMLTSYQRRFQRACESLMKVRKLLAEADCYDARARRARSGATKNSLDILKRMTEDASQ